MTVTIYCGKTQFKYSGVNSIIDDGKEILMLTFKDGNHAPDKHNLKMVNFIMVELKDKNL